MADWVKTNTLELIGQIKKLVGALNNAPGMAASGLVPANFAELTANAADLHTKQRAVLETEAAYRAAVGARDAAQAISTRNLRRYGMSAGRNINMTNPLRHEAGLTVRDTKPSPGPLPEIKDLVCVGRPNGNNFLNWSRVPGGVGVIWEVECCLGSSGEWFLIGATSRTDFLHEKAGAGVHRLYRIVARRGNRRGGPGNLASVYGG